MNRHKFHTENRPAYSAYTHPFSTYWNSVPHKGNSADEISPMGNGRDFPPRSKFRIIQFSADVSQIFRHQATISAIAKATFSSSFCRSVRPFTHWSTLTFLTFLTSFLVAFFAAFFTGSLTSL